MDEMPKPVAESNPIVFVEDCLFMYFGYRLNAFNVYTCRELFLTSGHVQIHAGTNNTCLCRRNKIKACKFPIFHRLSRLAWLQNDQKLFENRGFL